MNIDTEGICILRGSKARDKLAAHSVDVSAEKYSEPAIVDCFLRFGEINRAIRPQVLCPVPAVEVDNSERDLSFPTRPREGDAGEIKVAAENEGSSRCADFIVEIATSNAEQGDLS